MLQILFFSLHEYHLCLYLPDESCDIISLQHITEMMEKNEKYFERFLEVKLNDGKQKTKIKI